MTQSSYINIKAKGLGPSYRMDSQTRKACSKLLSLYLLFAEKIEKRFERIQSNATGLLFRFCAYIEKNYINSTALSNLPFVHVKQLVRTNNNVERTHNHLKAAASKFIYLSYQPNNLYLNSCDRTFINQPRHIFIENERGSWKNWVDVKASFTKTIFEEIESECKEYRISELCASFNLDPISSKTLLAELGKITKRFSRAELRELRNTDGDSDESD